MFALGSRIWIFDGITHRTGTVVERDDEGIVIDQGKRGPFYLGDREVTRGEVSAAELLD